MRNGFNVTVVSPAPHHSHMRDCTGRLVKVARNTATRQMEATVRFRGGKGKFLLSELGLSQEDVWAYCK